MYKQTILCFPGRSEKFQTFYNCEYKVPIDSGILYFRVEIKSNNMEASMSIILKTVIWNSLPLRNKYILHRNKFFFDFAV
jgi:NADH:ubiquinone oxidoreductase subunit D